MAGWTHEKRVAVEQAFYRFLNRCYVNSKDLGRICLGEHLYDGQIKFITTVFDALENDIHKIFVVKSRQLGISTIARALAIFLLGIHPGLKGAVVFDTDQNKQEARAEIEVMINDLPRSLKFPGIKSNNRAGLTLQGDSKVLFMSAGVRKSKSSGTLGRSVGLALSLCSELCSWDNSDGLEAFEQSLSEVNPDRLYIYESTCRGYNRWWEMVNEAEKDPHCVVLFLGWWSKPAQSIPRTDPDFIRYGEQPPTEKEEHKIKLVKELYDHQITPEQLAWVRRKYDPTATFSGDAPAEYEADPTRLQEQPWTMEDAWQQTGSVFFAPEKLTDQTNDHVSDNYQTYMYVVQDEFQYTQVLKAPNAKMVELKVWEPPVSSGGVYVLGADPGYGENPKNDRSALQLCRCYADGLDQVAEFASPLVTTQHLAWVIASLLGWYGAGDNVIRYILELNGPGTAVYTALKSLKFQIEHSNKPQEFESRGLQSVFKNAQTYIYNRADAMGPGFNYHFKTTINTKVTLMERFRDHVQNGMLRVRSIDLINEMRSVSRDEDRIEAPGSMKDDRVIAGALAVHCWEDRVKKDMMIRRRTREAEAAKARQSIQDQVYLFQQNQLSTFFAQKHAQRITQMRSDSRARWRYR